MKPKKVFCVILSLLLFITGCRQEPPKSSDTVSPTPTPTPTPTPQPIVENVFITDKNTYYDVILNFETGASHARIGEELGRKILKTVPRYEALMDSYLMEITQNNDAIYGVFLQRTKEILPQVPQEYRQEIEGMAVAFSGGTVNAKGDGKLSLDELCLLNLLPDVARGCQCSAFGAFGPRTESKNTILERTLDWHDGSQNQAAQIHAVVTIKNGPKSICLIGYLGFVGVISGFNASHLFAAILDAPTGSPYSSAGKRSYPMDIRFALENRKTINEFTHYMTDPVNEYTFNHLIFLADDHTAKVLENSATDHEIELHRTLRCDSDKLNPGIAWGYPNCIAAVNAFIRKGNADNFPMYNINKPRWKSLRSQLWWTGNRINSDKIKQIASYYTGKAPGPANPG